LNHLFVCQLHRFIILQIITRSKLDLLINYSLHWLLHWITCLPANKRIFAHLVLPWRAAFMSGVKPKVFLASTSISGHLSRRMLRHSVCPVHRYVTETMYWHHRYWFYSRARPHIFHNSWCFGSERFSARVIT